MKLELEDLTKRWGQVVGADRINLDIGDGEFVAFLGPSGCGKTTTLLMVAGIYKPTEGTIRFDERIVNSVAPRALVTILRTSLLSSTMNTFNHISALIC